MVIKQDSRIITDVEYLEDADLAETVGASVPTVRHWRSGAGVPHPVARPNIFRVLKEKLLK